MGPVTSNKELFVVRPALEQRVVVGCAACGWTPINSQPKAVPFEVLCISI